jgi:protein O-GlcNAc transferase
MTLLQRLEAVLELHRRGRLEDACRGYQDILRSDPSNFNALHLLGLAYLQQDRPVEASQWLGAATKIQPALPELQVNYARALQACGNFAGALDGFDKALALQLQPAAIHCARGTVLQHLGQMEEALTSFDVALTLDPQNLDALNNRGVILQSLGRPNAALVDFDAAMALQPDRVELLNNRGITLQNMGRFEAALENFEAALALRPDYFEALYNRGTALHSLKRFGEALESFEAALSLQPTHAGAWMGRGAALQELKRSGEASESYAKALQYQPDNADAHYNRGILLLEQKCFEQAEASFDAALSINPSHVEALNNRGSALWDMAQFEASLASYDAALAVNPNHAASLYNRGNALWEARRDYDGALRDLERLIQIQSNYAFARGHLFHLRMESADWRDYEREAGCLDAGVRAGEQIVKPFIYQAASASPADIQACAKLFAEQYRPIASALNAHSCSRQEKIRIGYVSGEFREQATAYLTAGLYECHDKSLFEIFAFDTGGGPQSPMRRRLERAFGAFVDISRDSDQSASKRITNLEIDILVNLNGYFGKARSEIFARRPAPIQVNYLGFPGTLGAPWMDYIIADTVVIPPDEYKFYNEKVVTLPNSYQANDARRVISDITPNRAHCGLPDRGFVFCYFNQSYKITPFVFAVWMRILRRSQGSVLWILESNSKVASNLRREATAAGIAPERLIFAPMLSQAEHLARLSLGDLFLDSLPCNAHTSASDALWAGLPLLTCRGKTFAGRVAASLLQAVGLPELIAENLEDYENLAVKLAEERDWLLALRRKLADNRLTRPLFNTDLYRRHIEAAYGRMFEIYRRGEAAKSFIVPTL